MFHDYFNKRTYEWRNWSDSCHITVFSGNTGCTLVQKRYSEMRAYAVEGIIIMSTESQFEKWVSIFTYESRNTLKSFSLFQIVKILLKLNIKGIQRNVLRIIHTSEPNVLLTKRRFVSGDFLVKLLVWFSLTLHYPKGEDVVVLVMGEGAAW